MTRNDFAVGQTVYLKTISLRKDCWNRERIVEATVISVGSKYITVTLNPENPNMWKFQFDINNDFTQKSNYSSEYKLFLSRQDILDYWQHEYLRVNIKETIDKCGRCISLDALKEIAQTLSIPVDYK